MLNNPFIKTRDVLSERLTNEYGRKYKTSPIFSFKNASSIATTGVVLFEFETDTPATAKYLPFNFGRITNNSDQDIEVYPNQDINKVIFIPAGVSTILPVDIVPAFRSLKIKNVGTGTVSAEKIRIFTQRDYVTGDQLLKRTHQRLFENIINIAEKSFGGTLI